MKRIINFEVSIGGMTPVVVRVEYEASYSSFEELKGKPYSETRFVFTEAIEALKKQIGHDDFNIQYWDWVV
jgi:hypothetical protein